MRLPRTPFPGLRSRRLRLPGAGGATLLALLVVAASPAAQNARTPIPLDPALGIPGQQTAIDSQGGTTAALWVDSSLPAVRVSVSDGRGLTWSAPVRVDDPPNVGSLGLPVAGINSTGVRVSGDHVYVNWQELDLQSKKGALLFARSTDGGASFLDEITLDDALGGTGTLPTTVMAVSRDPGGDNDQDDIYVMRIGADAQLNPRAPEVVASHDGGATFGPAVTISSNPPNRFPAFDSNLYANGNDVYALWVDDTSGVNEVWFQRSVDGGLTWLDFDVMLSSGQGLVDDSPTLAFTAQGATFDATYIANNPVTLGDEIRHVQSNNAGLTWFQPLPIGGYPGGVDIQLPAPHRTAVGDLIVAWQDDRSGTPQVWAATAPLNGNFGPDVLLSSDGGLGGVAPSIVSPTSAFEPATVAIAIDGGSGTVAGNGGPGKVVISHDGGFTFPASTDLDASATGDVDYLRLAYDEAYDNYLAAWTRVDFVSGSEILAGGVRPQTLTPNTFSSGGSGFFDLAGFAPATSGTKFAWVLAANSPGSFPLPVGDGRDLGLAFDSTLVATLSNPGLFLVPLDLAGTGTTANISVDAPTGTTFYAAAVALQLSPVALMEITDVFPIVVQ